MDFSLNNTSVSKLIVNNQKIYIKLLWQNSKDNLFHIKLYEGTNSWSGEFSSDFASFLEEPEETYISDIKRAFAGSCDDFKFDFEHVPGSSNAKLCLKKVFEDSTEMPYGSVELKLNEDESKEDFIDFLLNENNTLKGLVEICDKKNTALNEKVEKCKAELEEFVNEKISLEANLYGKFVQLLNEKKERIRLLEESIQDLG